MNIKEIKISEIKAYINNAKTHDEKQIGMIAESIKAFGFRQPLVIDRNNEIVVGHGRFYAAKKLGLLTVPCEYADDLTDDQIKAYRLADNKLNESPWDFDKINEELSSINFDMADFGFDVDLSNIDTNSADVQVIGDEVPDKSPLRCKLGDIWQLGRHRLICGDSTDVAVIDRLMNGVKADMVFTDPPYGMNAVSKSGVLSEHYKTDIMNDDDNTVAIDAFNLAREYFKDAKQIWWGANYYTECLPSSECWIVWDKNNGASDQTDCELAWANMRSVVRQFTMASEKTNRVHPTQKPCKLFAEILHKFDKDNSVKNVVDLFGGSGSTLIACEQLNRKCYMVELDSHYCDVIIQRWENFTGKKAVLLEG